MQRVGFVPATLTDAPVIFVGEAPGEQEVAKGEGFVGQSGQLLRRHAREAGIERFALTNAVHCRPPGNADPKPKVVQACLSQFVLDEIRGYPYVALFGNVPLHALFPGAQAPKFRGNFAYHPDFPGQRFFANYHPAYVLRRRDLEDEFARYMQRLARVIAGEAPQAWRVVRPEDAEFPDVLERTLAAPLISFDIETTGLESWLPTSAVTSVAFTADGRDVVVARREDAAWVAVLERLRQYLTRADKQVVGHNIGFDLVWMEDELDFRVRVGGIHDTAVIWHEARQYKMPSLKELVARELDGYRHLIYEAQRDRDPALTTLYNAEDAVRTLELFHRGMQILRPRTRDLVARVTGPAGYILRRTTRNGIHLRAEYRAQKIEEYQERRRAAVAAWQAADPDFVPSVHEAGKGLHEYLFGIKGLPVERRTEKGDPSVDRAAIKEWIRGGAAYLEHLLTLREIDKILSTYLTAYDRHVGPDGRIHSSYTTTYTDSGRSSSRDPNLQNIPRAKEIRDLFGVPPGHVLLESDLSQIEFRIMVCRAGDENGIQGYLRGDDAHTMTARAFAPHPTKEHRTWAKAINFALLFEGDWYNVQTTARDWYGLDWSERQARAFVDGFFRTYPRIPAFHADCHRRLEANRGWFESVTGHVHYYADWNHADERRRAHAHRSAINAEAQGPAAQICFLIMVHAERLFVERRLPARMVNTVHDSVLVEIADRKAVGSVIAAIEEAREIAHAWVRPWFPVPLVLEHAIGESWGSLEEWRP